MRGKFIRFVKMRSDGFVVIPKEARIHLGIDNKEAELAVFLEDDCIVFYPKEAVKVVVET